ncbi:gelsolin [Apiospora phragmitis]|uniref:Gelsolin n=1 Tax=Apiospora phragmitis TaxID=2905665 RepID=A0ABR1TUY9_9PEZI
MKRNDSISKRWSVQSPTGLQRADSVVSNRTGNDQPSPRARPKSMIVRETPTETSSRPTSRSTSRPASRSISRPTSSYGRAETVEDEPISSKVTNSLKLSTKPSQESSESNTEKTPPETPSKSMDPRRWSPTKSSWLESALNKPESPKPKPISTSSNQPAWMAEIAKAKAQKANSQSEIGRTPTVSHKHEVSIGGLTRSFAPGTASKPTTPTVTTPTVTTPTVTTPTVVSHRTGGGTPMLVSQRTGGNGSIRHTPSDSTATAEAGSTEAELSSAGKPKSPSAPITKPSCIERDGRSKKTERVDEFKEALLAKKKEFQQTQSSGRGISRHTSNASENPIPEGLAKSLELARAKSVKSSSPGTSTFTDRAADREKSGSIPDLLPRRLSRVGQEKSGSEPDPLPRKSSRAGLDANQESPKPGPSTRTVDDATATPTLQKETSAPGRLQGKIGGSLANRFNPALAGLLARGPPPMASGNSNNGNTTGSQGSASATDNGEGGLGPKLTHMTKGRARGPRRKAPTTVSAPAAAQEPVPEATETQKPSSLELESTSPKEFGNARSPIADPKLDVKSPVDDSAMSSGFMPRRKSTISSYKAPGSPSKIQEQLAAFAGHRSPSPTKRPDESESLSQPPSPRKLDVKRMSRFLDESNQDASKSPQREALKSPQGEDTPKPLFSKPSSPELKSSPLASPSRPLPEPTAPQPASNISALSIPNEVAYKLAMEGSSALTDFFGTHRPKRDYRADAAELLMNRPSTVAPQIRTLDTHVFQLSADGKKVPVRAGHERHLFEGEMYLCSHTFNSESGKKTSEVYFWAGCEVPGPVVEDASIFVSREARSIGGNLIQFRQGKETPEFLAALGGIVITQRGSSVKYDSLAPRILCGRRYMGQIVFDEADFVPASLCSGFPYLITTSGRCYLWKGKGSGVDELSCARLVGMDYALMGELEEIEDGHEPDNFWALFEPGTAAKAGSADHWRLKPNYEKYCSRLFKSDEASKQQAIRRSLRLLTLCSQIVEVCPFSQSDLQSTSIYVLDAFFELYIIVGKQAQSQSIAILAAGMEDRPFVPISTVVLEGIPRDMKSVFRKWQDTDSPTLMPPPDTTWVEERP